ncbi:MAG: hypothetical protein HC911_09870 [Chloroflexaceae bacterium]|nr:hypothetical protein [Chloroflexaceae bacterium]
MAQSTVSWLLGAATVQFIGLLIAISGWRYILLSFGVQIPLRQHFKIYTISILTRRLPGIGLDILSRTYLYKQKGFAEKQISVIALTEMVIFGLSGAVLTILISLFAARFDNYTTILLMLAVLVLFGVLIASSPFQWFLVWLNQGNDTVAMLKCHYFYNWIAINVLTVFLGGLTIAFLAFALGYTSPDLILTIVQAWAITVGVGVLFFWVPGGSVFVNGVLLLALSTSLTTTEALTLLILFRVWVILAEVLWGTLGLFL